MSLEPYLVNFPKASPEKVEESFNEVLPFNTNAYIRKFDARDFCEDYYLKDGWGIFSADGRCRDCAVTEPELHHRAVEVKATVHTVH